MQRTEENNQILKNSAQSISVNTVDSQKIESPIEASKELFDTFANDSFRSQQRVTAITSAVISALAVLVVFQIFVHTIGQQSSSNIYSVMNIVLAALTGVTVGLVNLMLGRISTNQIERSLNHLQPHFQELNVRLQEAEQKAEREEKEKEELQNKMSQILQNLELNYSEDLTQETNLTSREEEEAIEPPGTLLDFLDNLHNWFKITTTPEQLLGSSTLEEVQQRKDDLQYRQIWLQALEEETNRELQLLSVICQSSEQE
ncbi:MAG: hypothetical protein U7123_17605 [Potamolinea sp.]